jgi:hypothetical protein
MRGRAFLWALPLLAACTLALPGGGGGDAPAPLATEAIETTTLDAPAPAPVAAEVPTPDAGPAPKAETTTETPDPEEKTAPPPAAEPAPPEVDPALLTPAALACQKQGGRYVKTGSGSLRACVRVTNDGGKTCRRETDCQGACLARSGTCAPVTPLFGCNDILQADGRRVTLCLD